MLNMKYQPIPLVDTDNMPNGDWLKWRTTGIGGSDAAAIYEVSGWTTKRALYYAKIGLSKGEPSNPFTLDFGHAVEPFVATWFQMSFEKKYKKWLEKQLDVKIKRFNIFKDTWMYQHPLFPFMQANLDYRFDLVTEEGKTISGIFECKTTSHHIFYEKWGWDKAPYDYELQTRHYMSIMNLDYTIIACACGSEEKDYCARLIKRDLDLEEELIEMEMDFWENNVQARIPPELSDEHGEQELEAFISYNIGSLIAEGKLPEIKHDYRSIILAANEYREAESKAKLMDKKAKEYKEIMSSHKAVLLDVMASKPRIDCEDANYRYTITRKVSAQKRIDSKRIKEERQDIYTEYLKNTPTEKFSVEIISQSA